MKRDLVDLLDRAEVKRVELAAELGIGESTLSLKLAGKRPLRVEEVRGIQRYLNKPENLRRLRRRRPIDIEEVLVGIAS